MYIRFKGNIHNISNYYSLVKGGSKDQCILLQKEDGSFFSLEFLNMDERNNVLKLIWEEMKKGTEFFDIDEQLQIYNDANRYNV
jgi:hypothetical protein